MDSPIVLLFVKIILFAIVLLLAFRSIRKSLHEVRAASWPKVDATATLSRAVESPLGQRRGFLGSHTWQVQYRYQVNGEKFTSGLVAPFPNTTQANAEMMAGRVEEGTVFKVHVNPNDARETRIATNRAAATLRLLVQVVIYTAAIALVIMTSFLG